MDKIYSGVLDKFGKEESVIIHKAYSTSVEFEKDYFDWVYIDGSHTYDFVLKDLNHYYQFMKSGGFLCGDDLRWRGRSVKRAVKAFCKNEDLTFIARGSQYLIEIH